jgi:hypothetical protein
VGRHRSEKTSPPLSPGGRTRHVTLPRLATLSRGPSGILELSQQPTKRAPEPSEVPNDLDDKKPFIQYLKALSYFDEYYKLIKEPPKPPKIADPYNYYNVSSLDGATVFHDLLHAYLEERSPPHLYMYFYDRALGTHSVASKTTNRYEGTYVNWQHSMLQ